MVDDREKNMQHFNYFNRHTHTQTQTSSHNAVVINATQPSLITGAIENWLQEYKDFLRSCSNKYMNILVRTYLESLKATRSKESYTLSGCKIVDANRKKSKSAISTHTIKRKTIILTQQERTFTMLMIILKKCIHTCYKAAAATLQNTISKRESTLTNRRSKHE